MLYFLEYVYLFMDKTTKQALIKCFEPYVTEKRASLFKKVVELRTRYITVVLEDVYQSHNTSAVLRSCDCFGIQDVHIIEERNEFKLNNDIALGAAKWLTLRKYTGKNSSENHPINILRKNGYRVVATSPRKGATSIYDFDITKGKTAFFFGTELNGLSKELMENADEKVHIPMHGFTESFNISVSAALVLQQAVQKLHQSNLHWQLSPDEKIDLNLDWLKKTVKSAESLEKTFLSTSGNSFT